MDNPIEAEEPPLHRLVSNLLRRLNRDGKILVLGGYRELHPLSPGLSRWAKIGMSLAMNRFFS